jgi:predicted metal-dependent peptidase
MSTPNKTTGTSKKFNGAKLTDKPIPANIASQVKDKLISARVSLLFNKPFFGNIACRFKLVPADEWCATAATDGRNFYYNHEFIMKLRQGEVEFLFGHELLHACYNHMDRCGLRDHQLFNIAADYVVNQDLVDNRIGELITTVPCLLDKKYVGMCAEEVYDDLYKNATKINISDLFGKLLDEHLKGEGDSEGDEEGEGEGNGTGRPVLSKQDLKEIKNEMRDAVLNAAKQCKAGDLPLGVQRMVRELTEPKMNWREILQQTLNSTVLSDYSFMVLSRKGWDVDAILPGMTVEQEVDVAVALDLSGSISESMIKDFLGEVKGIMSQFTSYRLHIWCFDTQVYNPQVFSSDNLDDIGEYQPQGGGGTSFQCNWDWMIANGVEPKRFIMFTDMYSCDGFGTPEYCETIFVSHSNPGFVAPHGITVEYEA